MPVWAIHTVCGDQTARQRPAECQFSRSYKDVHKCFLTSSVIVILTDDILVKCALPDSMSVDVS